MELLGSMYEAPPVVLARGAFVEDATAVVQEVVAFFEEDTMTGALLLEAGARYSIFFEEEVTTGALVEEDLAVVTGALVLDLGGR